MKIGETGIWENNSTEGHLFDKSVAESLVDFFKKKEAKHVYDFGCGTGKYVDHMNDSGILCYGYDGNPFTENITKGKCKVLDLSVPVSLTPLNYVLSLEVGEHIPKKFEDIFIENIHKHNIRGVVLSWAIKGQGGNGHFNEQDNQYIKEKFLNLGYKNNIDEEQNIRKKSILPWFRNTIMIFEK